MKNKIFIKGHEAMKSILRNKWSKPSIKDLCMLLLIMGLATVICILLRLLDEGTVYVAMIYLLAVFIVSRITTGYSYGIIASIVAVFLVNYVFTYPYFEFNFTISGYPLTFFTMMAVSLITSTMTTQIKTHEKIRMETEKERLRANLLRGVSHDLRTPLTSIVGVITAIIDNDNRLDHTKRITMLNHARADAQWLIRMVENLLSVTRINGMDTKIEKEIEVVEEIIAEAVTKFKKHFPNQEVKVTVPEELLLVPMDAILIEQVISNLLENAAIHSGVLAPIMLEVKEQGEVALFEVKDSGKGISEKELTHLFEDYFYHLAKAESDSRKNMGIGLSVCYSIVAAHDGKLEAYNSTEGGAVFRFTLPLRSDV